MLSAGRHKKQARKQQRFALICEVGMAVDRTVLKRLGLWWHGNRKAGKIAVPALLVRKHDRPHGSKWT